MRKIIFSHRRAVGDALMFTCGVRDFKLLFPQIEINVDSNFPEVFKNNPFINRSILPVEGVEFHRVGYPVVNNANAANTHFTQAFLFDMIASADSIEELPIQLYQFASAFSNGRIGDPDIEFDGTGMFRSQDDGGLYFLPDNLKSMYEKKDSFCQHFARIRPDIHLSEDEKKDNLIQRTFGIDKYWVVAPGGKRDCTCKIWDWRRFQKVIDHFDGYIKFVKIGRSDHLLEKLDNVIDLTDKYRDNLRGLFPLVYHSDGCVSNISLLHHLCAGVPNKINSRIYPKPCITLYGGREPITFTIYNQTYPLHTNGSLSCCEYGGCWHSRIVPLPKDQDKNNRLCRMPIEDNGRTIQKCMDMITADDVIRQIELIYSGNVLSPLNDNYKPVNIRSFPERSRIEVAEKPLSREINFLASMKTDGGGEQSANHIVNILRGAGWRVNFYPWAMVHSRFSDQDILHKSFVTGVMENEMKEDIPLIFYANDNINDFVTHGQKVIDKSSDLVVCINFINGILPSSSWLNSKLRGVIFQNEEKMAEFGRDEIGLDKVKKLSLFGAIDLDKYIEICIPDRNGQKDKLVVLKHCKPDYRKYVTHQSYGAGDKIHIWQKQFDKDKDVDFYKKLIKDTSNIYFEFMEAHSELSTAFPNERRMKFWKWDEISVPEFLARGHVYLYRTSNLWRDQYPRVVAEALAAGLPVITEPRDGTKDRVIHGDTGFYAVHYDEFKLHLSTLKRKESARRQMGMYAKDWAKKNLDPKRYIDILNHILEN